MAVLVRVGKASWRKNALIVVVYIKKVFHSYHNPIKISERWVELCSMEPIRNQDLFHLVALLALVMVVAIQLLGHVPLFVVMDCRAPGFRVLHYLLEFAQIHVF